MVELLLIFVVFLVALATVLRILSPLVKDKAASIVESDPVAIESFATATARMEQRIDTIERIMTADNPNWRQ